MAFIKEMMGGGTSAGQASAICGAGGSVVATGSTIADAAPILAAMRHSRLPVAAVSSMWASSGAMPLSEIK